MTSHDKPEPQRPATDIGELVGDDPLYDRMVALAANLLHVLPAGKAYLAGDAHGFADEVREALAAQQREIERWQRLAQKAWDAADKQAHERFKDDWPLAKQWAAERTRAEELERERDHLAELNEGLTGKFNTLLVLESRANDRATKAEADLAACRAQLAELQRPITMQDVRLAVGEGVLKDGVILKGCNAELQRRASLSSRTTPQPEGRK